MTAAVVIVGVVLVVAVVAWFVLHRQHPENAASHGPASEATTVSDDIYGHHDRPAGPDAEPMDPDRLGGDQRPPQA